MAIWGCSLDETELFCKKIDKLREKINSSEQYRSSLMNGKEEYLKIKKDFQNFVRFLKYTNELKKPDSGGYKFYRVRKIDGEEPYSSRKELIYPEQGMERKGRMDNNLFPVLYTSLHEFTAIAESRMDENFIGKYFQLTRFTTEKPFRIFQLGTFSEAYLNNVRDSDAIRKWMKITLGSEDHDKTIQGYSALECALADIFYDQRDNYYYLSSILADAIFSENTNVNAIVYPSVQNRYGINFAFKKEFADSLKIAYSCMNRLEKIYRNGFYKYSTEKECLNFSDPDNFEFTSLDKNQRHCYR